MDDFGTSFSSFAFIKHLQANVLKIDSLFIRSLYHELGSQVRSIIKVALGLKTNTIAEFLEREVILEMLKYFDVKMVQVYHLYQPRDDPLAIARRAGIASFLICCGASGGSGWSRASALDAS